MKFIANKLNGVYPESILPSPNDEVDQVFAAIAYGANSDNEERDLIGNCVQNKYRLDIWMRYDHTVPVAVPLLQRLLLHQKDNVFCKLIPDYLHSKVIWWKGYGAYIGSANLTSRAWMSNIEAGVFFNDAELQLGGLDSELERFFDELRNLDVAFPLSADVIAEMEALQKARQGVNEYGKNLRKHPFWDGPNAISRETSAARRKESFRMEWSQALSFLENIGKQLSANRPSWVREDVPIAWQTDQFLHAYYYNRVGDGLAKPYEEYYERNRRNPQGAVSEALDWWKNTASPPSLEDETFYVNAPRIRGYLSKERILGLSEAEFCSVVGTTHATRDHILKIDLATLGRPDLKFMSREERIPLYTSWLLKQVNEKGWHVKELLHYVLHSGSKDKLWERIFEAGREPEYQIRHYGLNSIAELAGWARPEVTPPRNGRTSKALRALGFDVRVY